MKQLLRAFRAENIKLKHSGILTTALLMAIVTPLIGLGFSIYSYFTEKADTNEPIYVFYDEFNQLNEAFINLFYPIIIIVTAARIAQLEHKNNTWQLMETQPVKRAAQLLAKFLKAYQICFFSIATYMIGIVLLSVITYILYPSSEMTHLSIDWLLLLKKTLSLTLGTGFLLALIYAFSVRFSNSFLSIIIGVGTLLLAPILGTFNLLPKWYPTFILSKSLKSSSDLGYWFTYNEYLSILATTIIMLLLTCWYVYKNQKWWVLHKNKVTIHYAFPILAGLAVFIYVNNPTKKLPSNETVIKGFVPENETITALYLLDGNMNDTLVTIPVVNQQFNKALPNNFPLKNYRLAWWDSKGEKQSKIIFSTNDLVEIQFANKEKNQPFKITGSRIAENSLNLDLGKNLDYVQRLSAEGSDINSDIIISLLKRYYKKDIASLSQFHTADNFTVRDDYAEIIKNELFYKYNLIWTKYKDLVARSNSAYEHKNSSLQDALQINFEPNENLIAQAENIEYFRYKIYELQSKDTSDDDIITKYQRGIAGLKNNDLKTQFAKVILQDQLPGINNLSELVRYETAFLPMITDKRAYAYYSKFITDKKRLTTGNTALAFKAITTDNQPKTLEHYKGKYVVVDFWATWCGPCIYQADYFEKHAIEYNKRGDVVFISLSVDENQAAWRKKVKLNDKNVVQLYAINQKALNSFYRINSIPRFIVIDPNGKIVNSSFVFPNDSNFKVMLDQLLTEA